jgi:IS30 family transposase
MRIIGCDLHARQQTVAMLDTDSGELVEKTLQHDGEELRKFYSGLSRPVLVGIEATGSMQWFLELMEELGIECRVGDPAKIRAAEPERPTEVEDRAIPGHWEGGLLREARNSHVATLVERHSRFCMLVKVPGKDTTTVVAALSRHMRTLRATLRRSLTWDRGLEMAQHKSFTMATDVQVYFCDPQSPWQRGSNENTNGLLRQYLPKKADLPCYSQSDLDEIVLRLNQRPRKTVGFETPANRLQDSVASTP